MKKILELLVTGARGMLGTAMQTVAGGRGVAVSPYDETQLDITDEQAVREVFAAFAGRLSRAEVAGAVLNAAAYTDVEGAEDAPDLARLVNAEGARIVAAAARDEGLGLIHISTDFVFDGAKPGPYLEDDEPRPLSVYGRTKLEGEELVRDTYPEALVVRTAWVYGPNGRNFPGKILDLGREGRPLRVVTDEIGSPTYTVDLAGGILGLVSAGAAGLYHLTATGSCSRYELAREVLRLAGIDVPVEPATADSFATKAKRPRNSVLDCSKAAGLGVELPTWQDGLARFMEAGRGV